jgi:ParB/RepB/Spo0J family partition protein
MNSTVPRKPPDRAVAISVGTRMPRRGDDPPVDTTVRDLPMAQITADPGQPRQTFDRTALGELAASIRANGLLQPITVRQVDADAYQIVAGERRFRATEINGSATIRAIVAEPTDAADIRVKQIIENDQRVDVTPLEQARSYQALMDETGWTVEELGQHIGKALHRITERTVLLKLAPEYQSLLASGNLKPSEATELARLTPRGQATLFKAIRSGACKNYNDLRAMANALVQGAGRGAVRSDARRTAAAQRGRPPARQRLRGERRADRADAPVRHPRKPDHCHAQDQSRPRGAPGRPARCDAEGPAPD